MMMFPYDTAWGWQMFAGMFVWWILLGAFVLFLVRSLGGERGRSERILRERFARGEIDMAEYDARRQALS